ncbi:hypothetical protein, partial [Romboutsia ilealis]|uniref:hypothetical protein n=1 Tax=Romboutsia ilealis TaxID=1115758 RepID=UPI00272A8266
MHQPIRNVNLATGQIRGGTFNSKKGIGVDSPNKLDIKQLYQFIFNGKFMVNLDYLFRSSYMSV